MLSSTPSIIAKINRIHLPRCCTTCIKTTKSARIASNLRCIAKKSFNCCCVISPFANALPISTSAESPCISAESPCISAYKSFVVIDANSLNEIGKPLRSFLASTEICWPILPAEPEAVPEAVPTASNQSTAVSSTTRSLDCVMITTEETEDWLRLSGCLESQTSPAYATTMWAWSPSAIMYSCTPSGECPVPCRALAKTDAVAMLQSSQSPRPR